MKVKRLFIRDYKNNIIMEQRFNRNGKKIYSKDYDDSCSDCYNFEEWWDYDENDRVIHYRDSTGYEEWKEYDDNGNISVVCSYEVYGLIRALKAFRLSGIMIENDVNCRK